MSVSRMTGWGLLGAALLIYSGCAHDLVLGEQVAVEPAAASETASVATLLTSSLPMTNPQTSGSVMGRPDPIGQEPGGPELGGSQPGDPMAEDTRGPNDQFEVSEFAYDAGIGRPGDAGFIESIRGDQLAPGPKD